MTFKGETIRNLVLLGAGGHARVLHALGVAAGYRFIGVCDPLLAREGHSTWRGVPVLGSDDALGALDPSEVALVNGIGQLPGGTCRRSVFEKTKMAGFHFPALVHPAAWVADSARLEEGVQVMAGAIVQPDCRIGENSIVNTNASIDHDCTIGAHVHIAPGATICGGVCIGEGAFVGTGAAIIQGIVIANHALVPAGTTLVSNLSSCSKADGRPGSGAETTFPSGGDGRHD